MWDLTDTRAQEAITYGRVFLTWQCLRLFLRKRGARRQLRFALDSAEVVANRNRLCGEAQKTRAHSDTVEYFHGPVPTGSLEDLRHKMRHRLDALECRERDKQGKDHFFAWPTNFQVDAAHVADLANRCGRRRWKIENEGFNDQKNGGFNLEHAYSITHYKN